MANYKTAGTMRSVPLPTGSNRLKGTMKTEAVDGGQRCVVPTHGQDTDNPYCCQEVVLPTPGTAGYLVGAGYAGKQDPKGDNPASIQVGTAGYLKGNPHAY